MVLQVYIRSRRRAISQPGHPALSCLPNGDIQGNAFGPASQLQRWDLQAFQEGQLSYVTLRASNGHYLSASPCGMVYSTVAPNCITNNEKWFLRNCPTGGFVSLMSFHGKYLSNECRFDCGKVVRADRDTLIDWCQWILVDDPLAMTDKTTAGKMAVAGIYTASLFLPLIGAIGVVTATKRSVSYGGSRNSSFSVVLLEEDTNRLVKVGISFSTDRISQQTSAAASSIAEGSSRLLSSATGGQRQSRNGDDERDSEMERFIPMNVQSGGGKQQERFSQ